MRVHWQGLQPGQDRRRLQGHRARAAEETSTQNPDSLSVVRVKDVLAIAQ
jgi:hypothetical protein